MKFQKFYSEKLACKNDEDVFNFLLKNLKPSIIQWSYFVNWDKVLENVKEFEISLNIFNYLIGKDDFDEEFKFIIRKHPEVIKTIPALVVRDGNNSSVFKILVDYKNKRLVYKNFDFSKSSVKDEDIENYLEFVTKTGLKNIITSKKIKNLTDYYLGVEAGLDSNGRKNRGGDCMEKIVEIFIKDVCDKKNYEFIKQADAEKIRAKWNIDVPIDKSSRRYDFVVKNKNEIVIFETNFYGGGGSKLKSTAGEYRNLYDLLGGKFKFVWITDGNGWKTTHLPLRETFNHNDYLFNLSMLENGILEALL